MEEGTARTDNKILSLADYRLSLHGLRPATKEAIMQVAENKHSIDGYCDLLLRNNVISQLEKDKLDLALVELKKLLPIVEQGTIDTVRSEIATGRATAESISSREEEIWTGCESSLIPGFDFKEAHSLFLVKNSEDVNKVLFLPNVEQNDFLVVPNELGTGEIFFLVILKMFRLQYLKDEEKKIKDMAMAAEIAELEAMEVAREIALPETVAPPKPPTLWQRVFKK